LRDKLLVVIRMCALYMSVISKYRVGHKKTGTSDYAVYTTRVHVWLYKPYSISVVVSTQEETKTDKCVKILYKNFAI